MRAHWCAKDVHWPRSQARGQNRDLHYWKPPLFLSDVSISTKSRSLITNSRIDLSRCLTANLAKMVVLQETYIKKRVLWNKIPAGVILTFINKFEFRSNSSSTQYFCEWPTSSTMRSFSYEPISNSWSVASNRQQFSLLRFRIFREKWIIEL